MQTILPTFRGVCNFLCFSCAALTWKISCDWVNKGMTSLSLKGDDAPLKGKHRYQLRAFPAAFQTGVNTNPTWRLRMWPTMACLLHLTDELNAGMAAASTKWSKEVLTSLPVTGLYHAKTVHSREQNTHSAHESCIMTSCNPASETVWQHSFI